MSSDITASGGRLSPMNIADPLMRGELYREIREAQTNSSKRDSNWGAYTIQPGDTLSPELVALKTYGLDTLKWVILIACGLDDSRERLDDGETIYLPQAAWLRERIRYYTAQEIRK